MHSSVIDWISLLWWLELVVVRKNEGIVPDALGLHPPVVASAVTKASRAVYTTRLRIVYRNASFDI
jgi:hypothetical protein